MEIVFVRHGQPRWSVDGISQPDPILTELGEAQASLVAERLVSGIRPVTEIIVSPAARSQATAAPLAAVTGIDPLTIDDLVEIKMPNWEGELEETVQRIFRDARHRPPDEWWEGLPGGESFRQFHNRITTCVDRILADRGITRHADDPPHMWERDDGTDGRVVIVAHGGTNSVALTHLLGVDPTPWEWERFILAHASIARVRSIPLAGNHVFSLRAFNDQEHLPRDMRTR